MTITHKQVVCCRKYVDRIRNPQKRAYAVAYYDHRRGLYAEPDVAEFHLTYMGAQAVRMRINAILQMPA